MWGGLIDELRKLDGRDELSLIDRNLLLFVCKCDETTHWEQAIDIAEQHRSLWTEVPNFFDRWNSALLETIVAVMELRRQSSVVYGPLSKWDSSVLDRVCHAFSYEFSWRQLIVPIHIVRQIMNSRSIDVFQWFRDRQYRFDHQPLEAMIGAIASNSVPIAEYIWQQVQPQWRPPAMRIGVKTLIKYMNADMIRFILGIRLVPRHKLIELLPRVIDSESRDIWDFLPTSSYTPTTSETTSAVLLSSDPPRAMRTLRRWSVDTADVVQMMSTDESERMLNLFIAEDVPPPCKRARTE